MIDDRMASWIQLNFMSFTSKDISALSSHIRYLGGPRGKRKCCGKVGAYMRAVLRYPSPSPFFPFGVVLEEGQMHFILKSSRTVCTGVLVSKSMTGSQQVRLLFSAISLHLYDLLNWTASFSASSAPFMIFACRQLITSLLTHTS
ncbi:hypothetical protein AMECASPLE_037953 [Ameca splendens]|uniref:Uncharacterized protein n=1 Tax=Ameca splendens TaxID=208324 RepID=A0ABV0YJA1_9TELE